MKTISSDSILNWPSPEEKALAEQIQAGRVTIITWLGLGRKPSGQIRDRLRREAYSAEVVEAILTSLQEDGYLNDEALALRVARQRQGRQAESQAALNQRMRRLGISEDAISAALPESAPDLSAARQLIADRFARQLAELRDQPVESAPGQAREQQRLWQKVGRFLASRGFSSEIIHQSLADFFTGIDSEA